MVQHPCWAPPDHSIGSICLYGLEVQELDSMPWWDRTKNLWSTEWMIPKKLHKHRITIRIAHVPMGWFFRLLDLSDLPWNLRANKKPFKLWRGDVFFLGHELDSFQSTTACGPPDIPSVGEPLRPSGLFFSFRNGSLHVTQQTDSSFVRLHDLVLSHSEWHSGDAILVSCGQRTSLNFCMTSPSLHMPRGLALWRSCISCISSKRWEMLPSISTGHRENHGEFKLSMFQFESEVWKPFCPEKIMQM